MKEVNGEQNVGATAFNLPNNEAPRDYNHIHYGQTKVPHPTNSKAKMVSAEEIMRQTREGR